MSLGGALSALYFYLLTTELYHSYIVYIASTKLKVVWPCETKLADGFFNDVQSKQRNSKINPSLIETTSRCELERLKY